MTLYSEIDALCSELISQSAMISESRRRELKAVADQVSESLKKHSHARITYICTHNSRRSQLAQLWCKAAALHAGLEQVYTYSGGTEVTAFNHRMVSAIERVGFLVEYIDQFPNQKYHIPLSEDDDRHDIYFSKKYDDAYNPSATFIAVLLCESAAESCPAVEGALSRVCLPYDDPGKHDGQEGEQAAYADLVLDLGREMVYMMHRVRP